MKDVNTASKSAVIEYPERSMENDFRSQLARAPAVNFTEEVQESIRAFTINEVILYYPVPKNVNRTHFQEYLLDHYGKRLRAYEAT